MIAAIHDDLSRLMAVMTAAFEPTWGEAWTRGQVEDSLLSGHCSYFLISPEGKPAATGEQAAGFTFSRSIADETELLLLAVDPKFRYRGLGALLLETLVQEARSEGKGRIFLEMRRGNPAERLYRRLGFQPVGERPNYYRTSFGERIDAVTFALSI